MSAYSKNQVLEVIINQVRHQGLHNFAKALLKLGATTHA